MSDPGEREIPAATGRRDAQRAHASAGSDAAQRAHPAFAAALAFAAVGAPIALVRFAPRGLESTYGHSAIPYELFGFTAALAMAWLAARQWRRSPGAALGERCAQLAPWGIGLVYATFLAEVPAKPFDYDCYEYAGRALRAGLDPYRNGLNYLYPPLLAQSFAALHAGLASLLAAWRPDPDALWGWIHYAYQCAQLGLVLWAFALLSELAQRLGLSRFAAAALTFALLLFDDPLWRTLRHGQINLWVLDLSLLCLLRAERRPLLAGTAWAIATQLKLYPLLLGLPLLLGGYWRVLGWGAAAHLGLVGLGTRAFTDGSTWFAFIDFMRSVYPGEFAVRNNSFHSFAFNTLHLVFDLPRARSALLVRPAASLAALAALGWFVLRAWRHAGGVRTRDPQAFLAIGADALAFSLLVSQSVWEHHFVFALPLLVLAFARSAARAVSVGAEGDVARSPALDGRLVIAALLILALPTLDLFPLGHFRVTGLLGLLWLTAPAAAAKPPDPALGNAQPAIAEQGPGVASGTIAARRASDAAREGVA